MRWKSPTLHFGTLLVLLFLSVRCGAQMQIEENLYIKTLASGEMELDLPQIEHLYSLNRETGIKNYLPQNITVRDSQGQIAQKFAARAWDQFVADHKSEYATTVKVVNSLNASSQVNPNIEYQLKGLEGKANMIYKGYFVTTLSYSVSRETLQVEISKWLQKQTKIAWVNSVGTDQSVSKLVLAYEF